MCDFKGVRSYVAVLLLSTGVAVAGYALTNRQVLSGSWYSRVSAGTSAATHGSPPDLLARAAGSAGAEGRLNVIRDAARHSGSGKAAVVFFSSAYTSCGTGRLLSLIKESAKRERGLGYLVILPHTFSQLDVLNFKTNLDVPFPIELADPQLTGEWLRLNEQYGEEALNGTLILVDGERVLSLAHGLEETKELLGD